MLQRLQEEIIKQSDDHSIFAWDIRRPDQPGLLADSPDAFFNCFNVRPTSSRRGRAPYAMTNRGLSLKLMAIPWVPDTYAARLDCTHENESTKCLGIFLRRLDEDDHYARVAVNGKTIVVQRRFFWDDDGSEMPRSKRFCGLIEINVRQKITASNTNAFKERVYGFHIHKKLCATSLRSHDELHGMGESTRERQKVIDQWISRHFRPINTFSINCQDSKVGIMSLGFDFDHNPVCFMTTSNETTKKDGYRDLKELSGEKHIQQNCMCNPSSIDTFGWSKISYGVAEELLHHPGMWAFKGDRIDGLSVQVKGFGFLQIARKETECGHLVWDVCRITPYQRSPSVDSASESD